MGGALSAIFWFLIGKLFGLRKVKNVEAELQETKKENVELRADLAGEKTAHQVDAEQREFNKEWEKSNAKERYKLLKKDFDNHGTD